MRNREDAGLQGIMPGFVRNIAWKVRYAASMARPGAFAARPFRCPICGPSILIRLSHEEIGVRCLRCSASAITLSMVMVLAAARPGFRNERVYELSSRGPLFEFLRREVRELTFSEYFDDVPPGASRGGVQCQDVERLTHADASFDVVTSTEVFEHVADDRRGFAEIRRVLRPGGAFLFTVPLSGAERTQERAERRDGEVRHLLPPEYHDDRIRGRGSVLVFRDYGCDVTERLVATGFSSARIEEGHRASFLGQGRGVVIAST
jgi:SAM-dependent methyltransferase